MFRHRKLVLASMLYTDITPVDAWWTSFFFWSISSFTDFLFTDKTNKQTNKQTNKRNLNVENYQKDKCFPSPHRWKLRPSWQSSQRKGFGRFLAWKKVFNCNNLLNESIQIKFYHSVFLAVVERLSFFSKNKWTNAKYEKLIWNHLTFKSPYLSCLMRQRENIFYIAWSEQLIKSQKKHVCDVTSSREDMT